MSDSLLEWLSFRRSGPIDAVPYEEAGVSLRRILGNFSLLGHLEMPDAWSWRVAPPALAALSETSGAGAVAVLCGARTPGVLRQLEAACLSTGAQMSVVHQGAAPALIRVKADSRDGLVETAASAGFHFQPDAGYSVLACVPSISRWPRKPCQMAGGRIETVRRFSGSRAQWMPSSLSEAEAATKGLFRMKRDWDWVTIIKSSPTDCAYIDDRAGRMAAAAKLRHATWDSSSGKFGIPVNLFPPALIARALVLCTGLLPQMDGTSARISFFGVNAAMLRLTLSILGLRLA
jgi:hypothetical protein